MFVMIDQSFTAHLLTPSVSKTPDQSPKIYCIVKAKVRVGIAVKIKLR